MNLIGAISIIWLLLFAGYECKHISLEFRCFVYFVAARLCYLRVLYMRQGMTVDCYAYVVQ